MVSRITPPEKPHYHVAIYIFTQKYGRQSLIADPESNTPRRIRTPNLLVRSQALYPIELWAHILLILSQIVAEREGFEPSVER